VRRIHHEQHAIILYLGEENRVLKAQLRGQRMRLTDGERRRLAVLGARLGRWLLTELATIVTPDTILRWHRQLIGRDGRGESDVGLHADPRRA
jgi:putative transposase